MKTTVKIAWFFTICYPLLVTASSERRSTLSFEEKRFDINKDKKIDYIIINRNKKISEIREDLNYDGKFDQQTQFFPKGEEYIRVVERKKIDQLPRKKISYWEDEKLKKIISLTQIDKNDDGIWDLEYRSHSNLFEFKKECFEISGTRDSQNFSTEILNLVNKTDEYTLTDSGFRVEKACFGENSKEWFLKNLESSIETGLGCLEKLEKEENGNGASKNLKLLKNILAPPPSVQIICDESSTEYNWEGIAAHATAAEVSPTSRLQHPGISFNPEFLNELKTLGLKGELNLKRTLFHELFHNLGYKHSHNVEYAIACETCCFSSEEDSEEVKSSSCKICKKSYSNLMDLEYLKDLSKFSEITYKPHLATNVTITYLKENPGSLDGLSLLAWNTSGVFSPVGIELSKIITSEFKNLTEDQKSHLSLAQENDGQDFLKPFEESSKNIAKAYFFIFAKQDPLSGLKLISAEEKKLNLLLKSDHHHKYDKFIKKNLHEKLTTIIDEVFVNHNFGKHMGDAEKEKELKELSYDLFLAFEK